MFHLQFVFMYPLCIENSAGRWGTFAQINYHHPTWKCSSRPSENRPSTKQSRRNLFQKFPIRNGPYPQTHQFRLTWLPPHLHSHPIKWPLVSTITERLTLTSSSCILLLALLLLCLPISSRGIDADTLAYVNYKDKQKPNNNTTEEVEITMRFYLDI